MDGLLPYRTGSANIVFIIEAWEKSRVCPRTPLNPQDCFAVKGVALRSDFVPGNKFLQAVICQCYVRLYIQQAGIDCLIGCSFIQPHFGTIQSLAKGVNGPCTHSLVVELSDASIRACLHACMCFNCTLKKVCCCIRFFMHYKLQSCGQLYTPSLYRSALGKMGAHVKSYMLIAIDISTDFAGKVAEHGLWSHDMVLEGSPGSLHRLQAWLNLQVRIGIYDILIYNIIYIYIYIELHACMQAIYLHIAQTRNSNRPPRMATTRVVGTNCAHPGPAPARTLH